MIVNIGYDVLKDERGIGTTVTVDVRYTMEDLIVTVDSGSGITVMVDVRYDVWKDERGRGTTVMVDVRCTTEDASEELIPAGEGLLIDGSCGCRGFVEAREADADVRLATSWEDP